MSSGSTMVYLNLVPIKSGGGQQNVLSFLEFIKYQEDQDRFFVFCTQGTKVNFYLKKNGFRFHAVGRSKISRLFFELFWFRKYVEKGGTCFTFFGPAFLGSYGYIRNIVGCAYSNLFYPEVDFWWHCSVLSKFVRKTVDRYRYWALLRSDLVILETEELYERASRMLGVDKTRLVKMSVTANSQENRIGSSSDFDFLEAVEGVKFLFLCGDQPNKRITSFIPILKEINRKMCAVIVLTLDESSDYLSEIRRIAATLNLSDRLVNVGLVDPEHVADLIVKSDFMVNIALLESFSNNFVEAWALGKKLVVAESVWAKRCCGEAAYYIDPSNIHESASILIDAIDSSDDFRIKARYQLESFPDAMQKNQNYYQVLGVR